MNGQESKGGGAEPWQAQPDLEGLPDEELRAMAKKADEILEQRKKEKREQALREIRRIAKEFGFKISVQDPQKKRGRPPKRTTSPPPSP